MYVILEAKTCASADEQQHPARYRVLPADAYRGWPQAQVPGVDGVRDLHLVTAVDAQHRKRTACQQHIRKRLHAPGVADPVSHIHFSGASMQWCAIEQSSCCP